MAIKKDNSITGATAQAETIKSVNKKYNPSRLRQTQIAVRAATVHISVASVVDWSKRSFLFS